MFCTCLSAWACVLLSVCVCVCAWVVFGIRDCDNRVWGVLFYYSVFVLNRGGKPFFLILPLFSSTVRFKCSNSLIFIDTQHIIMFSRKTIKIETWIFCWIIVYECYEWILGFVDQKHSFDFRCTHLFAQFFIRLVCIWWWIIDKQERRIRNQQKTDIELCELFLSVKRYPWNIVIEKNGSSFCLWENVRSFPDIFDMNCFGLFDSIDRIIFI